MFLARFLPPRILSLQARKPSGLIGRYIMTPIFNAGNADLNNFVLHNLELQPTDRVLEIGFGPGKLIHDMANIITDGSINGIDFSGTMLKQASKVNRHHIDSGKVRLQQCDCMQLPFDDASFDKLCTSNTLYFWRQPEVNLGEIHRVLRPGGRIAIGFRDAEQMRSLPLSEDIFRTYSRDEVINLLGDAGFQQPHITGRDGSPFYSYCAVASRI
ncbi:MAG: class I SAM-dependent methyltransferase [Chromatiales bacterium]|jgi:ubiquinone/menaquinone biosynthesis C-methylase UbiE